MNRKEKGWLAEAAVKRAKEAGGKLVFNLSTAEPGADLLCFDERLIIEVKYGRRPSNLMPKEKRIIEERRVWCASQNLRYELWCTERANPPRKATAYRVDGLQRSKQRNGLSLSVFNLGEFDLPLPETPHFRSLDGLVTFTPATEVRE